MKPGDKVFWLHGRRIYLVVLNGIAGDRASILRRIIGWSKMEPCAVRTADLFATEREARDAVVMRHAERLAKLVAFEPASVRLIDVSEPRRSR